MNKRKKKIIICTFALILILIYMVSYVYRYINAIKPDIRYYDKGTEMDNFGLKYTFDGKIYNSDEFIKEFGVEKYEVCGKNNEYEKKYIVVKETITKTKEEIDEVANDFRNIKIYNKYWQVGCEMELTDKIQLEEYVSPYELNNGETTNCYQVYSIADCNLCKRLWNDVENTTVWLELTDTGTCPYVRRIRILN